MRIAYLDCFAGISGDMLLGALVGAGVPAQVLQDAVAALGLGASLKIETVDRSGISCVKVNVFEGESPAEGEVRTHTRAHGHEDGLMHQAKADAGYMQQPKTRHLHKTGHAHSHTHEHEESAPGAGVNEGQHGLGRSLSVIRGLIERTALAEPVKRTAVRAFELLGAAEAKIHNVPAEDIHFHEVGAVDAIMDIVAASAGVHHLRIGAWHSSPVNVGGGMVVCAHGTFPVPAPATAELLRGAPTYSAHVEKELTTPTGAALLCALEPRFGPQPAMRVEQIGYGAGTRNPKDFPNVLRLSIGEEAAAEGVAADGTTGSVTVIETALDDLSPQVLAYVTEAALAKGALDVMLTPVIMKKGRPGTMLTVLCNEAERGALERLILSETSTLGVRIRQDRRVCLERGHTSVRTEFGEIRMKTGSLGGEEMNAAPEFEDCRAAAAAHEVPVKLVQQAAIAAYRR
jgi:uncharacterized protein (TIGR00299 family) protein